MAGCGLLLAVIFVPTVSRSVTAQGETMTEKRVRSRFNPMRVIELLIYPNVVLTVRLMPTTPYPPFPSVLGY